MNWWTASHIKHWQYAILQLWCYHVRQACGLFQVLHTIHHSMGKHIRSPELIYNTLSWHGLGRSAGERAISIHTFCSSYYKESFWMHYYVRIMFINSYIFSIYWHVLNSEYRAWHIWNLGFWFCLFVVICKLCWFVYLASV